VVAACAAEPSTVIEGGYAAPRMSAAARAPVPPRRRRQCHARVGSESKDR
jgi:hypothetical protein